MAFIWISLPYWVSIWHSFHHPWPHRIQIGPNWDLGEALNNRYRLPAPTASSAPGHFGVLLIKMHLLAFVVVAIKWIIRPKTKKNLFSWSLHLNAARNSSAIVDDQLLIPSFCQIYLIVAAIKESLPNYNLAKLSADWSNTVISLWHKNIVQSAIVGFLLHGQPRGSLQ